MTKLQFDDLRAMRKAIIRGDTESIITNLTHSPQNSLGEFHQYIFQNHDEGRGFEGDQADPSGNNILLLAMASGKEEIVYQILQDAYKKLTPQSFKEYINFKYEYIDKVGAAKAGHIFYINTPLTLAIKFNFFKIAHKLLDLGADPKIYDYSGNNAMQLTLCKLGLGDEDEQKSARDLVKKMLTMDTEDLLNQKNTLGLAAVDILKLPNKIYYDIKYRAINSSQVTKDSLKLYNIDDHDVDWLCRAMHSAKEIESRPNRLMDRVKMCVEGKLISVIADEPVREMWYQGIVRQRIGFSGGASKDSVLKSESENQGISTMKNADNLRHFFDDLEEAQLILGLSNDYFESGAAAGG